MKNSKELFNTHELEIYKIYSQAFAGYPWFEDLSIETVKERVQEHIEKTGFELVTIEDDGELVGTTWLYEDTDAGVKSKKNGEDLLRAICELREASGVYSIVYICETIVSPDNQGKGIASKLKEKSLDLLSLKYPEGVIAYTRMRNDNHGIVKINTRAGLVRSGVTVPSSSNPDVLHEYWYKVINPQK